MWIKFKNGTTINLDTVIKYEKSVFGSSLLFHCNGFGFSLKFESSKHRDLAIEQIEDAIKQKLGFFEIDIKANQDEN